MTSLQLLLTSTQLTLASMKDGTTLSTLLPQVTSDTTDSLDQMSELATELENSSSLVSKPKKVVDLMKPASLRLYSQMAALNKNWASPSLIAMLILLVLMPLVLFLQDLVVLREELR